MKKGKKMGKKYSPELARFELGIAGLRGVVSKPLR